MAKTMVPAPHEAELPATVLVCAHDRRQYLADAVKSVLAQDIDRSKYELVVVKSFRDREIDSHLEEAGANVLFCPDPPLSAKVVAGLHVSRGRVILLLDDDDLFVPSKLRTVLSEFDSHADLGFYHNHFSYIGSHGELIGEKQLKSFGMRPLRKTRRIFLRAGETSRELRQLAYSYSDFNTSCLAIRRDLAVNSLPYLSRLDGGVDTFFLYVALVSQASVLIDDAPLTQYRVHDENISLAGGPDEESRRLRLLTSARRQGRSHEVTREMVVRCGNRAVLREIDARILVNRLSIIYRDLGSRRLDAVRALIEAVRLRQSYAIRENVPSVAGAFMFAVAPHLTRFAYDYQMSIR